MVVKPLQSNILGPESNQDIVRGFYSISLTIPVSTASVERSFSKMKLIKTCLQNSLGEYNLSHLMKISIESPENSQIVTLKRL